MKSARFASLGAIAALLLAAPAALAGTVASSNWAGYAIHRSGLHLRSVSGRWRVATATCQSDTPTFSAMWIGLGGYDETSNALEQTGTESDCSASGQPVYTAWYELVPAAANRITLTVHPGDLMSATVTVNGHRVGLRLSDLTTHHTFATTLTASAVDDTSAEWILEAPSECDTAGNCRTLPLADFSQARFGSARAVSLTGHRGAIESASWGETKIVLAPDAPRFVSVGSAEADFAGASPSALSAGGTAFTVNYETVAVPSGRFFGGRAAAVAARPGARFASTG